MAYNVCRPIILYNDFLPPDEEPHNNWDYLAFGYFDGIAIGENLLKKADGILERLWEHEIEQTKALNGRFSSQVLYGFRCEEETCDEDFWNDAQKKEGKPYPFIFVTLIQEKTEKWKTYNTWRQELEVNLTDSGKRKAITYLTLDNNSLMLILICRDYEDGALIIDSFHRGDDTSPLKHIGMELSYSFTIAAVRRQFLNDEEAIQGMQGPPAGHVFIYAIEKEPNSIEGVRRKIECDLQKDVKKESILGCNDEVIIAEDVPWRVLLKWFQDGNGIFNHSSKEYRKRFIGVTTIIGQRQNLGGDSQGRESDNSLFSYNALRKMLEEIGQMEETRYRELERYLRRVINSVHKFDNAPVEDYLLCSLFMPIRMVLEISASFRDPSQADRLKRLEGDFFDSFYEFVKALNLCVQNSNRSDRQFTQSLDFNVQIYSIPVRLNAFYNAFIYNVRQFLNDPCGEEKKHEYEFLTCPGVVDTVQVSEIFKNMLEGNRLFLVNIPENEIYDMRLMLIMLGHEVGHFVGKRVRNRPARKKYSVKVISKITTAYFRIKLKKYVKHSMSECDHFLQPLKEYWRHFESVMEKYLFEQMDNLKDLDYLKEYKYHNSQNDPAPAEEFCSMYEKYGEYSHVLRETLVDSVIDVLHDHRKELFGYLQEKEYLYGLERKKDISKAAKKRQRISEAVGDLIIDATGYSIWDRQSFSVMSAAHMMMDFFKECEADLVAILMLELSFEDYLYAIWKSIRDQGVQNWEIGGEMLIRVGLVTCCMRYPSGKTQLGFHWENDEYERVKSQADEELKKMSMIIEKFSRKYLSIETCYVKCEQARRTVDVFFDSEVLELLLKYLLTCRDTFYDELRGQQTKNVDVTEHYVRMQKIQKHLKDVYKLCREKNAEKLVFGIREFVEDYRQQLWEEIRDFAERKVGNG